MPINESSQLILHALTTAAVQQFCDQPSNTLLLTGPEGTGKTALAEHIVTRVLRVADITRVDAEHAITRISPEKQTISIDAVRTLQQFVKLKLPGRTDGLRRAAIIEQAHTLSTEAQNALLKLLEEPPLDTILVLTATSPQRLLPTIRSRLQSIQIIPPTTQQLRDYFMQAGLSETNINRAALLSGGLPGLMHALLTQEDHPLNGAVTQARGLLQASSFERLAQVDILSKQKDDTFRLLGVLQQMARAALRQQAGQSSTAASREAMQRWHRILAAAFEAEAALSNSAQAKLVLTNLMLSL